MNAYEKLGSRSLRSISPLHASRIFRSTCSEGAISVTIWNCKLPCNRILFLIMLLDIGVITHVALPKSPRIHRTWSSNSLRIRQIFHVSVKPCICSHIIAKHSQMLFLKCTYLHSLAWSGRPGVCCGRVQTLTRMTQEVEPHYLGQQIKGRREW